MKSVIKGLSFATVVIISFALINIGHARELERIEPAVEIVPREVEVREIPTEEITPIRLIREDPLGAIEPIYKSERPLLERKQTAVISEAEAYEAGASRIEAFSDVQLAGDREIVVSLASSGNNIDPTPYPDEDPIVVGDVNGDGIFDQADLDALTSYMFEQGDMPANGDVNGDGTIDISDLVELVERFIAAGNGDEEPPEFADINGDGTIDITDLVALGEYVQALSDYMFNGGPLPENGDVDGDGTIDIADLVLLNEHLEALTSYMF